ncbi:DEAD/DEAH box helicase family protein [Candidatus Peregrinibacteria bacterium]|nr:DEAD/DEAH box helicase family protein [Candidatus Peregrinibacteria bacterium]
MANPYDILKEEERSPIPRGQVPYLVEALRAKVAEWRWGGYKGLSDTTYRLFAYWFGDEHIRQRQDGTPAKFQYYFCQQEAIETIAYLYEVEKLRTFRELSKRFGRRDMPEPYIDSREDIFARYVIKMATGSGKTKVMSLAMVWSYFHKLHEPNSPMTTNFLVIAPNVIVFQRLMDDFGNRKIFREDPLIPPEWEHEFSLSIIPQDAPMAGSGRGALYVTNIHRLYEDKEPLPENPIEAMLGRKARPEVELTSEELIDRVCKHKDLIVFNDESHHLHDERLVWSQTIKGIHSEMEKRGGRMLMQLDFSATPKHTKGNLFAQIIVDYPLRQAIDDGIVKEPVIGTVTNADEVASENAWIKYQNWITPAIERWREYRNQLAPSSKKPVLFIMAENTDEANKIAEELEKINDFKPVNDKQKVLLIHTNRDGEVDISGKAAKRKKDELETLRDASRKIDSPDNHFNAIVSVLMLREGWDVKNVTVVVGLRAYSSPAEILPEQTIGRGLRRMEGPYCDSSFKEQVDVLGTGAFIGFVKGLEKEGIKFKEMPLALSKPQITTIAPLSDKANQDLLFPNLPPRLSHSFVNLESLKLSDIRRKSISLARPDDETLHYIGENLKTREIIEREYKNVQPTTAQELVAFFTKQICKQAKINVAGAFANVSPIVYEYCKTVLFAKEVDMENEAIIRRLNDPDAREVIYDVFIEAIRKLTIKEREASKIINVRKVSSTKPFPWTKQIFESDKTVFNYVACDNNLELDFARALQVWADVKAFAKLTFQTGFYLEYLHPKKGLHSYYPDWLVLTANGERWIIETKGRVDVDVQYKDARAKQWCEDATKLSGEVWKYARVDEKEVFRKQNWRSFEQLMQVVYVNMKQGSLL